MNIKLLSLAAIGSVGALGLTACGGDGGGGGGGGASDDTVTIGLSAPLSGPAAAAGFGQNCGIKAYLESVNDDGGINGYKFKIDEVDNQYDPAVAASVARDFANQDVFAVFVAGTATGEASRPALEPREIAMFVSGDGAGLTPPKWDGEFGYYPPYAREAASAARFVVSELGEKEVSFVYIGAGAGASAAEAFPGAVEAEGGTLAHDEGIPTTTTDFAPVAQKLKSAGAPVVYSQLIDTQLAGLQKAADAIGYNPTWVIWPIGYGPTYVELAGDLAQGSYVSQWAWPASQTDEQSVTEFRKAVESLGGKCAEQVNETNVATGYGIGAVMAYGVEQITEGDEAPTREAFIEALEFEGEPFGTTPQMTYDEESHAGVSANSYWKVATGADGATLEKVTDWAELPE
jgi:ABC-type branched-subunit amino acid transport system substrate-binding protein